MSTTVKPQKGYLNSTVHSLLKKKKKSWNKDKDFDYLGIKYS